MQMKPNTNDSKDYKGDVEILECLVKGVSKDGIGLYKNRHESRDSLWLLAKAVII
jgi:hypothetical protein